MRLRGSLKVNFESDDVLEVTVVSSKTGHTRRWFMCARKIYESTELKLMKRNLVACSNFKVPYPKLNFFSVSGKTNCAACKKKCSGDVLRVQEKFFHINCFKCKSKFVVHEFETSS